jgi:hypothetical protein
MGTGHRGRRGHRAVLDDHLARKGGDRVHEARERERGRPDGGEDHSRSPSNRARFHVVTFGHWMKKWSATG